MFEIWSKVTPKKFGFGLKQRGVLRIDSMGLNEIGKGLGEGTYCIWQDLRRVGPYGKIIKKRFVQLKGEAESPY